jgi:hypothetical protein
VQCSIDFVISLSNLTVSMYMFWGGGGGHSFCFKVTKKYSIVFRAQKLESLDLSVVLHFAARGPQAHLLTGVHEQSYIGVVMGYAGCLVDKFGCPAATTAAAATGIHKSRQDVMVTLNVKRAAKHKMVWNISVEVNRKNRDIKKSINH